MPIYTPKTDYSALKNAISYQADAAQAGHRITQQGIDKNRMEIAGQVAGPARGTR